MSLKETSCMKECLISLRLSFYRTFLISPYFFTFFLLQAASYNISIPTAISGIGKT